MSDYLLMVHEDESVHVTETAEATARLIEKQAAFAETLRKDRKLKDRGRLRPSREGKRVRHGGVEDGPFVDDGRALGTYYWIEAEGIEAAARIAATCPTAASDEIDVRPLMKGKADAEKEGRPGKIFAFAVLGNAPDEEGWMSIMDRIDTDTHGRFPDAPFAGGLRLMPPKTGRRVKSDGSRRAVFDGPFYESKEVIGGVFFMRMLDIDEAVRWASQTRFVVHGTLEIRELWRS